MVSILADTTTQFNPKLEADTLLSKFQSPVLLVTYDGLKPVSISKITKYDVRTDAGIIEKRDITFAVPVSAVNDLGEGARIDKQIEAQQLRTAEKRKDRPQVLNDEILQTAVSVPVKTTMLSGHVFSGTLVEYNKYNLLLNVNNHLVLIYLHAVHQFEVVTP